MTPGPTLIEPGLISGRMSTHVPHHLRRDGDTIRIYCPECQVLWYFDSTGSCYEERVVLEERDERQVGE